MGAFASYGYRKDPENHNHLVVDPAAAEVVRRIYRLYESGMGQIRIAKLLNQEGVPCPSEYKRLQGQRYTNMQPVGQNLLLDISYNSPAVDEPDVCGGPGPGEAPAGDDAWQGQGPRSGTVDCGRRDP